MPTQLLHQAFRHQLGTELIALLTDSRWVAFSFAVAWVRKHGVEPLRPSLQAFLSRGGVVRGIVGVDLENTTSEGLSELLSLATAGDAEFYVHHNEARDTTFHPKIYLLTSTDRATLLVGSNNLTNAGLYTNTEAALQVTVGRNSQLVRDVELTLENWRDSATGLVRQLTPELLQDLEAERYVLTESDLRGRKRRAGLAEGGGRSRQLFGRRPTPRPRRPPHPGPRSTISQILIMRVRRSRGTQVQLPIRLSRTPFFNGITEIVRSGTGEHRRLSPARSGGGVNTIKFELPETAGFVDPVVRFQRLRGSVEYTAYDAPSREGRAIMHSLNSGLGDSFNPTHKTVADTRRATLYRFV